MIQGPRHPVERWRLARLMGVGAIGVGAQPEHVFLDESGWTAYRGRRRRRVLTTMSIVLPLVAAILWAAR